MKIVIYVKIEKFSLANSKMFICQKTSKGKGSHRSAPQLTATDRTATDLGVDVKRMRDQLYQRVKDMTRNHPFPL
jgi:hypothetical protein